MSRLQIDVLGTLRLTVAGRPVRLHSRKQRLLLAALLVKAPRAFSAERLVDVLWEDELPADPLAALQVHVSRLRRALSPPGGSDAVVTEAHGYRLALDDLEVDASRFERHVNEARRTDRAEDALASLDAALSLWRGAAYDEFADLPFARAESARLEELRTAGLEQRAETLIALERLDEALELLERLASTHPLRERPRDQLMRVLYRRGRQADALAVCREFRRLLSEELGLEPSPALLQLEDQVLRHDLPVPSMETVIQGPEAGRAPSRTAPALDIRYVDAGEHRIAVGAAGTGPPLVVLPGFISNLRTIAEGGDPRSSLLALLSRRVRLITYDRYGTGLSRGQVGDYSASASAAELASILDTLGLASVPVLGISCSGPIAVTLAVRRPDLVSHLVLLGTYADGPRSFGGETVTGSILGLVRAHWGLGSKLLTDLMYPCATPEFARWFARGQRDAAAAEDAAGYLEAMFQADVRDLLGRVRVPSLVIHYTGDRAIPFRGGQDLAAGLSGARFVPLGGSLHLPEGEDAARVVELIGEFLG